MPLSIPIRWLVAAHTTEISIPLADEGIESMLGFISPVSYRLNILLPLSHRLGCLALSSLGRLLALIFEQMGVSTEPANGDFYPRIMIAGSATHFALAG